MSRAKLCETRVCDVCGKGFVRRAAPQKRCSPECVAEHQRRTQRSLFEKGEAARVKVPCLGPGAEGCTGTVVRRDDEPGNRLCRACRVLRDARVRSYSPTAFAPAADAGID